VRGNDLLERFRLTHILSTYGLTPMCGVVQTNPEEETRMSGNSRPPQKHLMTPGSPRPQQRQEPMSLGTVQRWVLSTLAATTIAHLAAGLVVAAVFVDETRLDSQIGLLVIAGAFGVIAVLSVLVIHQHRLVSPWLLLGLLPTLVGAYFIFWS